MQHRGILGILLALASAPALATMTIGNFVDAEVAGGSRWELMKVYVQGLGDSYMFANAQVKSDHGKPLYCPPYTLALTVDNYVQLLDGNIKD